MLRILACCLLSLALRAQDYSVTARVNPGRVYAGHPLTIELEVDFAAAPYSHIFPALKVSNPGISASLWCGAYNPACWGSPPFVWNTAATSIFSVIATPAATAAPGAYTVTVDMTANGVAHSITLPFSVLAVPTSIPPPPVPPLAPAALKAYEAALTNTVSPNPSVARCDPAAPTQYPWQYGVEGQAWYYDGANGYYQLADYFNDPKWKVCAISIASTYQAYVATGATPGWRVFTKGLRRAYEETGEPAYKAAVQKLATASPYAMSGGGPEDTLNRETAYVLTAYTDAHLLGIQTDPAAVARALDYLLGDVETLFSAAPLDSNALTHQTFMDGLMFESLIYYYDNWNKDPRIPAAIKKGCDWIWQYAWDDTQGKMLWNPYPSSSAYPHFCDAGCGTYQTLLAGLVQPAFWWYWQQSRDLTYLTRGDRIFGHLTDDPQWSGKQLMQLIKWSVYALTNYRNGGL